MSGENRRGLGRGLSALLGEIERGPAASDADTPGDGVRQIALAEIKPHPDQPRRIFDEDALDELAASIAARGVLQPIMVRRHREGFQIVAGERRWRAAQRAGLKEIPALVRDLTDSQTLEIAIIENIQRADLNAIEEAEAYQRLMRDFGHNQEALGRFVNKSRSHVANLLRLLDLPERVRARVADGALSMGHARALVTADDPETLADQVVRRRLSVRDTERLARTAAGRPERRSISPRSGTATAQAPAQDADILSLQQQLGDMLGLDVAIGHDGGEGGGTVTLRYASLEQLDMICQRLSGERF